MKQFKKLALLVAVLFLSVSVLTACGSGTKRYNVKFDFPSTGGTVVVKIGETTVTNDTKYKKDSVLTITVTPAATHNIKSVTAGTTVLVASEGVYTHTLKADVTLKVEFEVKTAMPEPEPEQVCGEDDFYCEACEECIELMVEVMLMMASMFIDVDTYFYDFDEDFECIVAALVAFIMENADFTIAEFDEATEEELEIAFAAMVGVLVDEGFVIDAMDGYLVDELVAMVIGMENACEELDCGDCYICDRICEHFDCGVCFICTMLGDLFSFCDALDPYCGDCFLCLMLADL